MEDDLMRIFGSEKMSNVLHRLGLPEGEALVHPWISKALEKAIRQIIKPGIDQQLSENIDHDYSAGNHAWHSIASEMQGIYETIIHKRRK